jgi:hypothetical protein
MSISAGAKTLQEKLHELLTRLAATIELVKNWPESEGDDASIHVETTTKLIASIKAVVGSVQKVDGVVKSDAELRKNLQDCLIPLDLLDLLDYGSGLNPDCFSRALLREALGQLAGLKRRKLALEMLGAAVQSGLNKREAQESASAAKKHSLGNAKRKRCEEPTSEEISTDICGEDDVAGEPPTKRQNNSEA